MALDPLSTGQAPAARQDPTRSTAIEAAGDAPMLEFHVSELAADTAGAMSPFGDVEFPLELNRLGYVHPEASARPHLLPVD